MSPPTPMTRLMNGVPSTWAPVGRRLEDDDVAALVGVEAGGQLVDQDVLVRLQGPLHRLLLDLVGLRDEVLDDEEDDEGEGEGLDDLEEAPERGPFAHKAVGGSQGRQYRGCPAPTAVTLEGDCISGPRCEFDPLFRRLATLAAGLQGPSRRCMTDGTGSRTPRTCRPEAAPVTRPAVRGQSARSGGPSDLMDASALQLIILPAGLIAVALRHLPRPRRPVAATPARPRWRPSPARSTRARWRSSGASTRPSASWPLVGVGPHRRSSSR